MISIAAMVGDVNIYMNDPDDLQLAEIEIMIAEHKRYIDKCSPFSPFSFMGVAQIPLLLVSFDCPNDGIIFSSICLNIFIEGLNC